MTIHVNRGVKMKEGPRGFTLVRRRWSNASGAGGQVEINRAAFMSGNRAS